MKKIYFLLLPTIWVTATFGCEETAPASSEDDTQSRATDSGGDSDPYETLSAPLFSIDTVMTVNITIDADDWNTLRYQAPGIDHFAEEDCPAGPRSSPYDWFTASVDINGESYDSIEIRKKGLLGSMTPLRPSIKLRFGDTRPGGIEHMTLNNAVQDPTYAHECLAYHLFRQAGLVAPRCGLAKVTVNGDPLGIYTHIEEIKKPLLRSQFGREAAQGDLYEITTADFTDDLLPLFEPKGDNADNADTDALKAVADALRLDDTALLPALETLIDMDAFYTFWAMEIITSHWDGYSGQRNNSYVYRNPTNGLFYFIPWGTDASFSEPEDFFGRFTGAYDTMPWSLYAHGALCRRLIDHPEGRLKYREKLLSLLETVWDEAALLSMLDTIQTTLQPHLAGSLRWVNTMESLNLAALIENHRQDILNEITDEWPVWDRPQNPPHCAIVENTYTGVLTTVSESLDLNPIDTGDGEVFRDDGSQTSQLGMLRGIIGTYADTYDNDNIYLQFAFGPMEDGRFVAIGTTFPKELYIEGNTVQLDYGQALTEVLWVNMESGDTGPLGFVATGEIHFETIEAEPGGTVVLSFSAPVGTFRI